MRIIINVFLPMVLGFLASHSFGRDDITGTLVSVFGIILIVVYILGGGS